MHSLLNNFKSLPCTFGLAPGLALLFCFASPVWATSDSGLSQDDCAKCHTLQVKFFAQSNGRHATELGCLDCHPQHPPITGETISACSLCHNGQAHYQLDNCLQCHADPHRPLATLRDPLRPEKRACLSCHSEIGEQQAQAPSKHAKLFCTRCHGRHKEVPSCLDCHDPHQQNQSFADCQKCHPAHQPLQIVFNSYLPAGFCRPCHLKQSNDLAATKTNHVGINCVYCHKGQHPSSPNCRDCHGLPHTQAIHSQYRDCLECHGDAHKLISNR